MGGKESIADVVVTNAWKSKEKKDIVVSLCQTAIILITSKSFIK